MHKPGTAAIKTGNREQSAVFVDGLGRWGSPAEATRPITKNTNTLNMIRPNNYCRAAVEQMRKTAAIPNLDAPVRGLLNHAIDLVNASTKFVVPDLEGVHGERPGESALNRLVDAGLPLRLPYPFIALEFTDRRPLTGRPTEYSARKGVVLACERGGGAPGDPAYIACMPVFCADATGLWSPLPEVGIASDKFWKATDRGPEILVHISELGRGISLDDYAREVLQLIRFLDVLQCSNVAVEKLPAQKVRKSLLKKKGALPFDDYHVLTITGRQMPGCSTAGGSHRSPREHLRRGHVRRYDSGKTIWVNAVIVAAGAKGRITKDYKVAL